MRKVMTAILAGTMLAAGGCTTMAGADAASTTGAASADSAALDAELAKFATVKMNPDTSFLNAEERQVVNLLIKAADLMSQIYQRQYYAANPAIRQQILASTGPDKARLLALYDINNGPWNQLDAYKPFFGSITAPEGAGFYPVDLSKQELDVYIAKNPKQKDALMDGYTVVKRDGEKLVAVPYSQEYQPWLEPAARYLEQAAAITSNASLKTFLTLRAQAFRTNDYYPSELAWMDIKDTPIEPVIGPYEVYTDRLYGQKTAFEAFITLQSPSESAKLSHYKALLPDMEANLPVAAKYKNANRPFNSPILVADQVRGGGDNVSGVQTIAFNLPNDERVRSTKGAKKVILANVLGAKYDRILEPIAERVLAPAQAGQVVKKYMTAETLFHELSHSLGPGIIKVGGRETTVGAELKEQYSASEECKADVMGVWSILYLMKRGEMPITEREQLLSTYFAGIFRAVRFGIDEAHGRGAAVQYSYLKEKGAFAWDASKGRYVVNYDKMEAGLSALLNELVTRQGDGDYAGMKAFLAKYAHLDAQAEAVLSGMADIPTDIKPIYPDKV